MTTFQSFLVLPVIFICCTTGDFLHAQVNKTQKFTAQELASLHKTGQAFSTLFLENKVDELGLLLLPKDMLKNVIRSEYGGKSDQLYKRLVVGNMKRFTLYRKMFANLSLFKFDVVEPGYILKKSKFFNDKARIMKNAYVALSYANRVVIKIKLETTVFIEKKCYILEID